jgi:NTE family protein
MKTQPSKIKLGLALSGGSTYGIAHIGALKALKEANIPIDCIAGTSAGSLVAACYAFGVPLEEMASLTQNLNWKKFSRFAYSPLGLRSNKPMDAFITDMLGDVNIEDAPIPLAIVATNIETHKMVVMRSGPLREAVRASTCLPGFFTPVEIGGQMLVDGGLTENIPITALTEMGATVKIGIDLLNSSTLAKPKNVLDVLISSFKILSRRKELQLLLNADVVIEPDLSAFNSLSFKNADGMFEAGYKAAKEAIPEIREKIEKLQEKPPSWLTKLFSWLWK